MRPASRAARSRSAPGHQRLDALVDVAQALLQPHHGLAVGGEAEMAGLDDAGVDRADRDLVQALALGRQEGVGVGARRLGAGCAPSGWRMPQRRDRARAARRARRRPSRPNRSPIVRSSRIAGGCSRRDRGEMAVRAGEAERRAIVAASRSSSSAMCTVAGLAEQRQQGPARPAARRSPTARQPLRRRRERAARAGAPRPARRRPADRQSGLVARHRSQPSGVATCWNQATSGGGR